MLRLGAIVDGADLVEVIWTSLAAGIGVTAVFGLAIHGAARAVDLRRNGHSFQATAFGVLCAAALAAVAGAIVLAIIVMTTKD